MEAQYTLERERYDKDVLQSEAPTKRLDLLCSCHIQEAILTAWLSWLFTKLGLNLYGISVKDLPLHIYIKCFGESTALSWLTLNSELIEIELWTDWHWTLNLLTAPSCHKLTIAVFQYKKCPTPVQLCINHSRFRHCLTILLSDCSKTYQLWGALSFNIVQLFGIHMTSHFLDVSFIAFDIGRFPLVLLLVNSILHFRETAWTCKLDKQIFLIQPVLEAYQLPPYQTFLRDSIFLKGRLKSWRPHLLFYTTSIFKSQNTHRNHLNLHSFIVHHFC